MLHFHLWSSEAERKREKAQDEHLEAGHEAIEAAIASTTDAADRLVRSLQHAKVLHVTDDVQDVIDRISGTGQIGVSRHFCHDFGQPSKKCE
jgi:hypothetical protein